MLHASQDVPCSARVRFWASPAGLAEFVRLVGTFVDPPPDPRDPEVRRALRAAVPPTLVPASASDVERRATDAAKEVATRLHMAREMALRYHDHLHKPPPPRHSVYVGEGDRGAEELELPLARNPHFERWRQAGQQRG